MELLNRWPDPARPADWELSLSLIARDEAVHLATVIRVLEKRGGRLDRLHKSHYASDLRKLVRMGRGPIEIVDRLLVSALIEARSCERFGLLAEEALDEDLAKLYTSLWSSEFGHYKAFLRLAGRIRPAKEVRARWDEMLDQEAWIIAHQPVGPCLHSGMPSTRQ